MKQWNKNNWIDLGVMGTIGVVLFFFSICVIQVVKAGLWYATVFPALAIGYACFTFHKKYYIKDVFKGRVGESK